MKKSGFGSEGLLRVVATATCAGLLAWFVSGLPTAHADFAMLWTALHQKNPYDYETLKATLNWGPTVAFPSPPSSLPIFGLFALLPYRAALVAWAATSGAALGLVSDHDSFLSLLLVPPRPVGPSWGSDVAVIGLNLIRRVAASSTKSNRFRRAYWSRSCAQTAAFDRLAPGIAGRTEMDVVDCRHSHFCGDICHFGDRFWLKNNGSSGRRYFARFSRFTRLSPYCRGMKSRPDCPHGFGRWPSFVVSAHFSGVANWRSSRGIRYGGRVSTDRIRSRNGLRVCDVRTRVHPPRAAPRPSGSGSGCFYSYARPNFDFRVR